MNNHGGQREGSGRKPKEERSILIDKLSAYDDIVFNKMVEGVELGDYKFIKLFMEYRYGKSISMQPETEETEDKTITIVYNKNQITEENKRHTILEVNPNETKVWGKDVG